MEDSKEQKGKKKSPPKVEIPEQEYPEVSKLGRPTHYNETIAKAICEAYASCKDGIEVVCAKNPGFPHPSTIYEWRNVHKIFDEMYIRARENKAEYVAALITQVAFDERGDEVPFYGQVHVQRDKLKFDALRWQASKLNPRKFGEKVDLTTNGKDLPPAQVVDLSKFDTETLKKAAENNE